MDKEIYICALANYTLERFYIEEWCEHYISLGVDKIVLLDDVDAPGNCGHSLIELSYIASLAKSGKAEIVCIPKHPMLIDILNAFYEKYNKKFGWCCIFDCDEFLSLKRHSTIKEWLAEIGGTNDVIQVPWLNYGDQGVVYRNPAESVKDTFLKTPFYKAKVENKVVVRGGMESPKFFISHACADMGGTAVGKVADASGNTRGVFDPFVTNPDYSTAELSHCCTKSTDEYIRRRLFGRIDTMEPLIRSFKTHYNCYFSINDRTLEKEAMFRGAFATLEHFGRMEWERMNVHKGCKPV